ncbi:MAG: hypothetical protein ABIT38_04585, partial [Gemmatimonadaceae bacterium]
MPSTLKKKSDHSGASDSSEAPPPEALPAATTNRRGVHVRRRMTPDNLPLWRDVLTLQQQLRPEALETIRASRRPANPVATGVALFLTVLAIVVWSV